MTDIVERLRLPQYDDWPLVQEAADEIEAVRRHADAMLSVTIAQAEKELQLQAEIERLRAYIGRHQKPMLCSVDLAESALSEAAAEIKRLRSLLDAAEGGDSG